MVDSPNQDNIKLLSFPAKLYELLEHAEVRGYSHIVSWQKEGRSFKIHNTQEFADKVMPSSFSQTKLKSFQRQLNMYGWKKVQLGPNKGGYHHRDFIRGCPDLCSSILRKRVKDVSSSVLSLSRSKNYSFESFMTLANNCQSENEPTRQQLTATNMFSSSDRIRLQETEVAALFDFFCPKDALEENSVERFLDVHNDNDLHIEGSSHPKAGLSTTHSAGSRSTSTIDNANMDLDSFVKMLEKEESSKNTCLLEHEHENMNESPDNCFPYKLHLMLENAERDNYSHIVSWVKGGTAFKVHDSKAFVVHVMPMFFDQSKYESFRRQLNLYFFTREARGPDRGIISHPQFLKGERWLCEEIKLARFLRR